MPATVLDIRDSNISLPEFLVLDASLVLELNPSSSAHPNHSLAINFLNRLRDEARRGEVIPIIPRLAFEECCFKLCKQLLTLYAKSSGDPWHVFYKNNPLTLKNIQPILTRFYQILLAFPVIITEPEDLVTTSGHQIVSLSERMIDLIHEFAVLPKDATIFSEAERMGIFTVATMDKDWKRADGFTVIVP